MPKLVAGVMECRLAKLLNGVFDVAGSGGEKPMFANMVAQTGEETAAKLFKLAEEAEAGRMKKMQKM